MEPSSYLVKQIGIVHSLVNEKAYTGWGEVTSEIHLEREYQEGLLGLEEYSHAIVIFYMDQFHSGEAKSMIKRPRDRADMQEVGVFSQRTKYRPNPIGVSVVEIKKIEKSIMTVKGLDANNNTPILDIKPYISEFDARHNTYVPQWMKGLMKDYF